MNCKNEDMMLFGPPSCKWRCMDTFWNTLGQLLHFLSALSVWPPPSSSPSSSSIFLSPPWFIRSLSLSFSMFTLPCSVLLLVSLFPIHLFPFPLFFELILFSLFLPPYTSLTVSLSIYLSIYLLISLLIFLLLFFSYLPSSFLLLSFHYFLPSSILSCFLTFLSSSYPPSQYKSVNKIMYNCINTWVSPHTSKHTCKKKKKKEKNNIKNKKWINKTKNKKQGRNVGVKEGKTWSGRLCNTLVYIDRSPLTDCLRKQKRGCDYSWSGGSLLVCVCVCIVF